jgi:hypothetical protein
MLGRVRTKKNITLFLHPVSKFQIDEDEQIDRYVTSNIASLEIPDFALANPVFINLWKWRTKFVNRSKNYYRSIIISNLIDLGYKLDLNTIEKSTLSKEDKITYVDARLEWQNEELQKYKDIPRNGWGYTPEDLDKRPDFNTIHGKVVSLTLTYGAENLEPLDQLDDNKRAENIKFLLNPDTRRAWRLRSEIRKLRSENPDKSDHEIYADKPKTYEDLYFAEYRTRNKEALKFLNDLGGKLFEHTQLEKNAFNTARDKFINPDEEMKKWLSVAATRYGLKSAKISDRKFKEFANKILGQIMMYLDHTTDKKNWQIMDLARAEFVYPLPELMKVEVMDIEEKEVKTEDNELPQ